MHQESEKEAALKLENQRLKSQISDLKAQITHFTTSKSLELQKSSESNTSLQSQITALTSSNSALHLKISELTSDCQAMHRMYKVLEDTHENLKSDYDHKSKELKSALSQSNEFQTSNFELALQVKQLEEQLVRAGESKETIEGAKSELLRKFNEYGEVIQKETQDKIEQVKRLYKEKKQKLVEKILSQKAKIEEMNEQMGGMNSHNHSIKAYYENQTVSLKADIQKLKKDHSSELQLQSVTHQKEISELTSKHKLEISNIQKDMQKAYEEKLMELEQESQEFSKKSQEEHSHLKQVLLQYQKEYLKISDHEQVVQEEVEKAKQRKDIEMQQLQDSITEEFNNRLEELEGNAEHFRLQYEEVSSLLETEKLTSSQLLEKLEGIESKYEELRHRTNELLQENGRLKGELDNDYKVRNLESKIRENKQLQKELEETTGKLNSLFLEREDKLKKDIHTFKEINQDLEQSLKEAQKVSKSDKKQIEIFEKKMDQLEKELDEITEKHRNSRKKDLEKFESEVNAHSNTKAEMRKLQDKLSEAKSKIEELKRKHERETNDIKIELEFTKDSLQKTDQKYKEAQYTLESSEKRSKDLEAAISTLENQLSVSKNSLKSFLHLQSQVQSLKTSLSHLKSTISQSLPTLPSILTPLLPKIQSFHSAHLQSQTQYHSKNTNLLQKLESQLQEKDNSISSLKSALIEKERLLEQSSLEISKLTQEYTQLMSTVEEKNRQIQQLKFSNTNPQREEDAYKLTKVITMEIDKKYKQTILQLIQHMEDIELKYKDRLKAIAQQVDGLGETYR